jgi:hypothetical protein
MTMKRAIRMLVVTGVLLFGAVSARADSLPVIRGVVAGIELCPQAWCGIAIFAGIFNGQIGFNTHALGTVVVAVHHGPLPEVTGGCTPIPDGVWSISTLFRRFQGVASGGLCYNGDNTFNVGVAMQLTSGGVGTMAAGATLDHNVFPPTIQGLIIQ